MALVITFLLSRRFKCNGLQTLLNMLVAGVGSFFLLHAIARWWPA